MIICDNVDNDNGVGDDKDGGGNDDGDSYGHGHGDGWGMGIDAYVASPPFSTCRRHVRWNR